MLVLSVKCEKSHSTTPKAADNVTTSDDQRAHGPPDKRRLHRSNVTVLAADVVGYTRLMELDENATHVRLMSLRSEIMEREIAANGGRIVKNTGDGFVAMFESVRAGMQAAVNMQRAVGAAEAAVDADRRIAFRMGLNITDVIVEEHDIYGDGVNVAARLESLAEPGGIVITGLVSDAIGGTMGLPGVDLGQVHLRNRQQPVRVVSLRLADTPQVMHGDVLPGGEPRPSIAVLPFRKLANAPDDAYFADGIVDDIIRALGSLRDLIVIARGSTLGLGGPIIDARKIGRDLGVRYVLNGSAQRSGDRLRIGTELTDTESGRIVWAEHHDGTLGDLFEFQDRIAIEVARKIAPCIRERELRRALRKHPRDMTAYDLVLQASDLLYRLDYPTFLRARELLQRAMASDPSHAPAFSLAAHWHSWRIGQGWTPDPIADGAEAARLASLAIACDPDDPTALAILGHVHSFLRREFDVGHEILERAVTAGPSSAIAWILLSATKGYIGDGPGAVRAAETALRLSPLDSKLFFAKHILAQAHYINGDFVAAARWARGSDSGNENHPSNLRVLAASLVAAGQTDSAAEVAQRHAALVPKFRLRLWQRQTPICGPIFETMAARLREAGFPE